MDAGWWVVRVLLADMAAEIVRKVVTGGQDETGPAVTLPFR